MDRTYNVRSNFRLKEHFPGSHRFERQGVGVLYSGDVLMKQKPRGQLPMEHMGAVPIQPFPGSPVHPEVIGVNIPNHPQVGIVLQVLLKFLKTGVAAPVFGEWVHFNWFSTHGGYTP